MTVLVLNILLKVNLECPAFPNFPVWFSKDLKDIIFHKRKALTIFKATGNSQDYKNFSFLRSMYKYESKKCYRRFVERTKADFCANPRRFWNFVRKNNKENSIPKIVTLNNQSSNSDADTANFFSNHFNSVYSNNRSFPADSTLPSSIYISIFLVIATLVLMMLKKVWRY